MTKPRRIPIIPLFPTSPDKPFSENLGASLLNVAFTIVVGRLGVTLESFESPQNQPSRDQEYKATRDKISLEKQQAETAKAQMQLLKAQQEFKLLELKVAEKIAKVEQGHMAAVSIQKSEMDLHMKTEVISGMLVVTAKSEGLTGPAEGQEAATKWKEELLQKVILILGKRGSGKTATAATLAEYMKAAKNLITYWVGLPQRARALIPNWIQIVESLGQIPNDAFVLIDEAGLNYLSLRFHSDPNVTLRQCLALSRQKNWTMVIVAQTSRDIDKSVISQCNSVVFKEPPLLAEAERPEIRARAIKAAQVFGRIPPDERPAMAMVFADTGFEGLVKVALPSFWSEELSNVFGQARIPGLGNQGGNRLAVDAGPADPPKRYYSDDEIREVRKQGHGYEKISKILVGVTVYRIRQVLAEYDPLDDAPEV